jgi:hypothetical protein
VLLKKVSNVGSDSDFEYVARNFQKWKYAYEQYTQQNSTTTTNTTSQNSTDNNQHQAGRIVGDTLFDMQPLIQAVDVVLNGSGCLLSELQYRDLIRQAPWVDLELFVQEVLDSYDNNNNNNNEHGITSTTRQKNNNDNKATPPSS